ncbi:MAG: phosphatidate cytidylyltransferase [Streptosporangiales bacterium]|nr:phosphatidate cytidylyltransferase [Streptosporangiales bacterium]
MAQDEVRGPQGRRSGRRRSRSDERSGRNVPIAIAVGLGLGGLILGSLYTIKHIFVGLVVVAIGVAIWELSSALRGRGDDAEEDGREVRLPIVPVMVGAVAMIVGAYLRGPEALIVALALTALAVIVWRLPEGADGYVRDVSAGVFVAVYAPFLASFAVLLLAPGDGRERVVTFFVLVVCSDTGGYFVGVLLGRHSMAPTVSPKKTWEGFVGSVLACMAAGAGLVWWLFGGELWQGLVMGGAVAFSATLGDLGESMLKRDLGVKDMGSLIPEHGGMMDRLDSLLATAPVVWFLLTLFVPPTP